MHLSYSKGAHVPPPPPGICHLSVLACVAGGIVSKFCSHRDQFALRGKTINVSFEELKGKDTFFVREWLRQKGLLKPCEIFES